MSQDRATALQLGNWQQSETLSQKKEKKRASVKTTNYIILSDQRLNASPKNSGKDICCCHLFSIILEVLARAVR